jgi:hypothetical protein
MQITNKQNALISNGENYVRMGKESLDKSLSIILAAAVLP